MLVQPPSDPIPFNGNNEYELINNLADNGELWARQREQLKSLIEWCAKTAP